MVHIGNKVSLSNQVANRLKQKIRRGIYPSGSTLPSVRKLCAEFGVSTTVICRALRELEAQGLVQTHQGKGTLVQQNSHAKRTAILFAFIQPYPAEMRFEQQVLQYAEQSFSMRDNFLVVRSSRLDVTLEREIAEHAANNNVQGILLWPVENNPNGPFWEEFSKKVPVVLIDRLLENANLPAVIFDTYEAGREICREMLETQNRKKMLCLIDHLNISPYQTLMQGLRDEAKDMGKPQDITLIQLGLSEFIAQLSRHDFSQVNVLKQEMEKKLTDGDYDTLFCPQEQFLDYVMVQTGLHEKLKPLQLVTMTAPTANVGARQYSESGTLKWCLDFPQMISKAADMLQQIILTGKTTREIIRLKIHPLPPKHPEINAISSVLQSPVPI